MEKKANATKFVAGRRLIAYAKAYANKERQMETGRRVKLFKNGRNQAVRIPREYELPGNEAILRKEGGRLVIEPASPQSLLAVLKTLKPIKDTLPAVKDRAPEPVDL